MSEPVKYVTFGGTQVPEGTKREVIDRNGQKIYCVWTDDKGGKVSYPKQETLPSNTISYVKTTFYPTGNISKFNPVDEYISKSDFERGIELGKEYGSVSEYAGYKSANVKCKTIGGYEVYAYRYYNKELDTIPKIEISTEKGVIFDTQNVTLSNMRGATVTGSTDEDNITLMNSSNCTVDVSNANNNLFVSDNVTVLNGQDNKVKAGDHDQVTFGTHDYETNKDITNATHKGEGTYRQ